MIKQLLQMVVKFDILPTKFIVSWFGKLRFQCIFTIGNNCLMESSHMTDF